MTVGSRLLSLFTLSSVAVIICSLQATPIAALSVDLHAARDRHLPSNFHDNLAKRKRSSALNKRCKPRPAAPAGGASPPPQTPAPAPPKAVSSPPPPQISSGNNGGILTLRGAQRAALAWANGEQDLALWDNSKLIYTWSPQCPPNAKSLGITCCPMIWGRNFISEWDQTILTSNTPIPCALGPNEPEIVGQSNMSPSEAVAIWRNQLLPLRKKWGTKLGSPATTSDQTKALAWLDTFFQLCPDCQPDFMTVHWYDIRAADFISWVDLVHQRYKLQVWVTEFACQNFNGGPQCSQAQVNQFQATVTPYLQNSPNVMAYSAFGAMHDMQGVNSFNQLMNADGSPNELARAYGYGSHP